MRTQIWLAAMIYPMASAVLFGMGIVPLLAIRALESHVPVLFPVVVVVSFVLAAPIAWIIAARLPAIDRRPGIADPRVFPR